MHASSVGGTRFILSHTVNDLVVTRSVSSPPRSTHSLSARTPAMRHATPLLQHPAALRLRLLCVWAHRSISAARSRPWQAHRIALKASRAAHLGLVSSPTKALMPSPSGGRAHVRVQHHPNSASEMSPPATSSSAHDAAALCGSDKGGSSVAASCMSSGSGMVIRSVPAGRRSRRSRARRPCRRASTVRAATTPACRSCPRGQTSCIIRTCVRRRRRGYSEGSYAGAPPLAAARSLMRPGKGEMRRAPACAAATAWMKPKMSVMLHVMPSFSARALPGCLPRAGQLDEDARARTPAASAFQ